MADRSRETMRTDRRLLERPGWISKSELERELAALPDVSGKIDTREDDPSGETPADSEDGSVSPLSEEGLPTPAIGEVPGGFFPSN